ncbi:MAG: beta-glucosidase [Ruminococcus sp.]|nr:beta-glucosidase [Ruminococcus sp.]
MAAILDWNVYLQAAADAVAEGVVLLKNRDQALPLPKEEPVAVFGRIQLHYYKSGTGSGGMVNAPVITGILDGLREQCIAVDETLLEIYRQWDAAHPYDLGTGWGAEPWSQQEMPLTDEIAAASAENHSRAVVVIGRTAGEEQDHRMEAGSYLLADEEIRMLQIVRKHFKTMIVLLNVGGIIDMKEIEAVDPDAIVYVWQGGMTGGSGTAAVLSGEVSPSGKLPDTIAYEITDYPSHPYFGDRERNFHSEDIYIGYRYFETFAKEKVRYPFGFGLSYTEFSISAAAVAAEDDVVTITAAVKNIGACCGKEVVQLYAEAPQGKLGKPARVLCGFAKTRTLAPGEEELLTIAVKLRELASYDDSGATGNPYCYVLEEGAYHFYLGSDVRSAAKCYTHLLEETQVTSRCVQCMAPVLPFERIRPVAAEDDGYVISMEPVPLSEVDETERSRTRLPYEIPHTGDMGITLQDVKNGTATLRAFIAQLSDEELSSLVRGEGMGSPRVTAGTASAFGGVAKGLVHYGIPAVCCSDGPSGMRLDCGTPACSLPNGTLLAATFNRELLTRLFTLTGLEMRANHVDCLLGPGMNLHRHPLNGRNFEYFSEDPYLTGMMAAAQLEGLHSVGVSGTLKHFCGNEQETNRHFLDAVISERALREMYLKGFELAVKYGKAKSIMTTYGSVNGLWTAGTLDLTTLILREEWGFSGIVMTDWWANINRRNEAPRRDLTSVMVAAQNDLYMVCSDTETPDGDIMQALEAKTLTRGELQRCASNICEFILHTPAMQRLCGTAENVEILNRPTEGQPQEGDVVFYPLEGALTIPLDAVAAERGTAFSFALDVATPGYYHITVTASSTAGPLAQMPVTLFSMGTAHTTFTWNGTEGKPVSFSTDIPMFSRFTTMRLYFAQSGLQMHEISFTLTQGGINIAAL